MKELIIIFSLFFAAFFATQYILSKKDPYEVGMHFDYRIECVNGFVYKVEDKAAMQVFNSDYTPLKCGKKIY